MSGIFKNKIIWLVLFLLILFLSYKFFIVKNDYARLSPPSAQHWFGTSLTGDDLFIETMSALGIEILTLLIVLPIIYILGLLIGMTLSYFSRERMREFLLNLIHYWVTLPVLLIALFLLILLGAGQKNAILVIIFVYIPTQALYVYNHLENIKKNEFVLAKQSYGFSKINIYKSQLYPNVKKGFTSYTLARMPEIIMMNLALNFLGLGAQPPKNSLGKMLFDGLSFMYSAWWLWIFIILWIFILFFLFNFIKNACFNRPLF